MAEELISLIEKEKAIWDKGSPYYKDKFEKEKAWNAVAKGFYEDWEGFSSEEKIKKLKDLKTKWKNIKDAMMKSLHTRSGDSAKKKKYVHFEALSFLLSAAEKRRTSGNYQSEDASSSEETEPILNPDDPPSPQQSLEDASIGRSIMQKTSSQPTRPAKFAKTTPFQASLLKTLERAGESLNQTVAQEEDADRLYLLSLLPDYKNLCVAKKWEFRQIIASFFGKAYSSPSFLPPPPPYQPQQFSQPWNPTQPQRYPSQNTPTSLPPTSPASLQHIQCPPAFSQPQSPYPYPQSPNTVDQSDIVYTKEV